MANFKRLQLRAQGCLIGLAVGDALGRPAENMSPKQVRETWGRLTGFVADQPQGSDDTEYAMLTAMGLLKYREQFTHENMERLWRETVVAQEGPFGGAGFSEMLAIRNLDQGRSSPRSGQHSHSWSDGLAMRVAPIGIYCAGDPQGAAALAAEDGAVSHSSEGIYAGQAVAAAVAVAMTGASLDDVYTAGVDATPADSWTRHCLEKGRQLVESDEWENIADPLVDLMVFPEYPWMDLAPEATGLAFCAALAADGDFRETILKAVNLGRDADTIAAIAGAIGGAIAGIDAVPADWRETVQEVPGMCLRATAGMHPLQVADDLVEASHA